MANHAVMAVLVGSTTETSLTLAFEPPEVVRGFWLGGVGWVVAVVLLVLPRRRPAQKTSDDDPDDDPDDVQVPRGLQRVVLWADMLGSAVRQLRRGRDEDEKDDGVTEEPEADRRF